MSKKVFIIVALAAALAGVSGVALSANNSAVHPRGADGDPTTAVSSHNDEADSDNEYYSNVNSAVETVAGDVTAVIVTESPTNAENETAFESDTDITDTEGDAPLTVSAEFGVVRVVDKETDQDVEPQVLFGHYASDCYLKMYSDCTAEICVNPSSAQAQKGAYSIYGDTMYVDFGGGSMTEYTVVYSDDNSIKNIIVPSGGFDIYFG